MAHGHLSIRPALPIARCVLPAAVHIRDPAVPDDPKPLSVHHGCFYILLKRFFKQESIGHKCSNCPKALGVSEIKEYGGGTHAEYQLGMSLASG
jgi:hypothetical protein